MPASDARWWLWCELCAFYLRAFYGLFYDRDKFHQLILFFRDNKIYIYFSCFAAVVTDNDDEEDGDEKKLSDRVKIPDR